MTTSAQVLGSLEPPAQEILTPAALSFIADLHRTFEGRRREALERRKKRAFGLKEGQRPDFLEETRAVRQGDWRVAPAPADLRDRRVEITGPADAKMMINALNSGAKVFMADLEDSMSPTWENVLGGQKNLRQAVRRTLELTDPRGKHYQLGETLATLLVRPRGWHLVEKNLRVDGDEVSASLVDFGLYFFHNAAELLRRGSGPYFYLPKLESHLEARLWNDVFVHAQEGLGLPRGTIRATVLIETLPAAFEMDEILYELREHASGLNAGRWDYIFSAIRVFCDEDFFLPDRAQITMAVPFMNAYAELLVKTCHARGAHAIGGMSAFIPSRRDEEVNRIALAKVSEDKQREAAAGSDGSWVAHPDLVPVVQEIFDRVLGEKPHQLGRLREDVEVCAADLVDFAVEGGEVTEAGVRLNVEVAVRYLDSWLQGRGAVAIHNLMEDAATAEISRAQLWQWLRRGVRLEDGPVFTADYYQEIREEELTRLGGPQKSRLRRAAELLDNVVLAQDFKDFLTLEAYPDLI